MKKSRFLCVFCLLLLLSAAVLPVNSAEISATTGKTAWITTPLGGACTWRVGPGKTYDKIGELAYRAKVTVFNTDGSWVYIRPDSGQGTGYVHRSFIVYSDPGPYGSSSDSGTTYQNLDDAVKAMRLLEEPYTTCIQTKRATNYCHLRWLPCSDGRVMDKYLAGEEIIVLAESDAWAQVQIVSTGYVGFILSSCVAWRIF